MDYSDSSNDSDSDIDIVPICNEQNIRELFNSESGEEKASYSGVECVDERLPVSQRKVEKNRLLDTKNLQIIKKPRTVEEIRQNARIRKRTSRLKAAINFMQEFSTAEDFDRTTGTWSQFRSCFQGDNGTKNFKHIICSSKTLQCYIASRVGIVFQYCVCMNSKKETDHYHMLWYGEPADIDIIRKQVPHVVDTDCYCKCRILPIKNMEHLIYLLHYLACSLASNTRVHAKYFKEHFHADRGGLLEQHKVSNSCREAMFKRIKEYLLTV